jgi:hypothetical protein
VNPAAVSCVLEAISGSLSSARSSSSAPAKRSLADLLEQRINNALEPRTEARARGRQRRLTDQHCSARVRRIAMKRHVLREHLVQHTERAVRTTKMFSGLIS